MLKLRSSVVEIHDYQLLRLQLKSLILHCLIEIDSINIILIIATLSHGLYLPSIIAHFFCGEGFNYEFLLQNVEFYSQLLEYLRSLEIRNYGVVSQK